MQPDFSMAHDYTPTPKVREIGRQMAADLRADPPRLTGYREFQATLASTAQIAHVAETLAHVHWLYEGWTGLVRPLTGEIKRVYERAATYAVRFCSQDDRHVAESRAMAHGVRAFDRLERDLRSCDTTPDHRAFLIRSFVRECLDVHRAQLMNGCGRTALELTEFERHEQEDGL